MKQKLNLWFGVEIYLMPLSSLAWEFTINKILYYTNHVPSCDAIYIVLSFSWNKLNMISLGDSETNKKLMPFVEELQTPNIVVCWINWRKNLLIKTNNGIISFVETCDPNNLPFYILQWLISCIKCDRMYCNKRKMQNDPDEIKFFNTKSVMHENPLTKFR